MLSAGTRIGPYEVIGALGAGGMGEVYRARDTKLNRDVALKVLPEAFARDPARMARFQREAQVLASLNHPNIASIYGLEESGGVLALVMELVEGISLKERIAKRLTPALRPRAFGRRAVALPTATLPAPFQGAPHASQIQEEAQSSSEAELCATADGRLTPHPALPRLRDRHASTSFTVRRYSPSLRKPK